MTRVGVRGQGGTFKVKVRGTEMWQANRNIEIAGVKKRVTGRGATQQEAWKRWEDNALKMRVLMGEAPVTVLTDKKTSTKAMTLMDFMDEWFNSEETRDLSPNARARTRGIINNHIRPYFKKEPLRLITEERLRKHLFTVLPGKKNTDGSPLLGTSPIRGVFYTFKQVFDLAERRRMISINPMVNIKPIRKAEPKDENIENRLDVVQQIRHALTRTEGADDEKYAHWIFTLYGLRQSERLGLEWDSFENLNNPKKPLHLKVNRQLYNDSEKGKLEIRRITKTKAGMRIIPMNEEVRQTLLRQWKRQQEWKKGTSWKPETQFKNLVYTTVDGRPIRQNIDNRLWREMLTANQIPFIRHHAVRHVVATLLAKNNVLPEIAMSIIGHSSLEMLRYYQHLNVEMKTPAMTAIAKAIEETPEEYSDFMWQQSKEFDEMFNEKGEFVFFGDEGEAATETPF